MKVDTEPQTAVQPNSKAPGALAVGCVLQVTSGPDVGAQFVLDGQSSSSVRIGQSPACEVRLTDRAVSRRHAALDLEPTGVRLRDLGSTNGTRVGGLLVCEAVLQGGEEIAIGGTTLRVGSTRRVELPASEESRFGKTIGHSPQMRQLYGTCHRLSSTTVPVIIEGETGTGKEVLAESIHDMSPRRSGPFVIFDCTTVVSTLVEATIFGHERGAFTGAVTSQRGLFEEADGGTLFIDEIGDLDIALQSKLLRAIERSEVRRVGGSKWTRVDVRIISATRRDLDREIQEGRFRDDLFFRLAVARIELPPLRKRTGDIALLATHFWKGLGGDPAELTGDFLQRLEAYDWPGNIRQLHNAIAQRFALGEIAPFRSQDGTTGASDSSGDFMAAVLDREMPFTAARDAVLAEFEQRYVGRVLAQHGGNVGKAAESSGIGRRYFQTIRARSKAGGDS